MISLFDEFIRRDPAQRGLIGSESLYGPLCAGHLAAAAEDLAHSATSVAIVTGFYIPLAEPPTAETDGPLGALFLAANLQLAGIDTHVITDQRCWSAVAATADAADYPRERILEYPHADPQWRRTFFTTGPGRNLSHLIAIERVGPSHSQETCSRQTCRGAIPSPVDQFAAAVPAAHWDRCHNMRGLIIDDFTADTHRLFEELPAYRPTARTIGIGDGGNEIGMGAVPWEELTRRLSGEHAGWIPCRIATDWNILAGTSNWGGYALAAATLLLRGQTELLRPWTRERERQILEHLVAHGPAVDGVTRRREPTVDGLPFLTYIQPLEGIRRLLNLDD